MIGRAHLVLDSFVAVVGAEAILRSLEPGGGLLMSEAVMNAPKVDKAQADHLVYAAAGRAMDQGGTLRKAFLPDAEVTAMRTEAEIDGLLDPPNYLGSAPTMMDAVLARYEKSGAAA